MKTIKFTAVLIALAAGLASCDLKVPYERTAQEDKRDRFGNTPKAIEDFYRRFSKEIEQAKNLPKPTKEDPFEQWKLRVCYTTDYNFWTGLSTGFTDYANHVILFYGKKFDFRLKYKASKKHNSVYSCSAWDNSSNEDWTQNYTQSLHHVDKITRLEFCKVYPDSTKQTTRHRSNDDEFGKRLYDKYANPNSMNPNSVGYRNRMKMFGL